MTSLSFALVISGAPGSQAPQSAWHFAQAAVAAGHRIQRLFLYAEGVHLANRMITVPNDEPDWGQRWAQWVQDQQIPATTCIASALRRGVLDPAEARRAGLPEGSATLRNTFPLGGLGDFIEATVTADRVRLFNDGEAAHGGLNLTPLPPSATGHTQSPAHELLFVADMPPYANPLSRELLDMALAAAAFDRNAGLLLRGAALLWVQAEQDGTPLEQRTLARNLGALPLYGIEHIYLDRTALQHLHITPDTGLPVQILDDAEQVALLRQARQVVML